MTKYYLWVVKFQVACRERELKYTLNAVSGCARFLIFEAYPNMYTVKPRYNEPHCNKIPAIARETPFLNYFPIQTMRIPTITSLVKFPSAPIQNLVMIEMMIS